MIHELIGDDLEKEQMALETETACKEGVMAINMGVTGCKGVEQEVVTECNEGVTGFNGDATGRHRGVAWCNRGVAGCNRV